MQGTLEVLTLVGLGCPGFEGIPSIGPLDKSKN
jgi:hypothetical protein